MYPYLGVGVGQISLRLLHELRHPVNNANGRVETPVILVLFDRPPSKLVDFSVLHRHRLVLVFQRRLALLEVP